MRGFFIRNLEAGQLLDTFVLSAVADRFGVVCFPTDGNATGFWWADRWRRLVSGQ